MIFHLDHHINRSMALARRVRQLRRCTAGVVAVVTAMTLPLLLGFTSLGVEVGHWYLVQREMQGAADAAAISAAAQYIADVTAGNPTSTTYQQVGLNYAALNGFTIFTPNVCLVTSGGDNCGTLSGPAPGTVRWLDSRPIICKNPPCVVVEIVRDTALWPTTKASLEPVAGKPLQVQSIPTPVLKARAIVSARETTQSVTTAGTDCILALANDPGAVLVHGNGDPEAQCGIAIDGGLDQNPGTPVQGGITFSGAPSRVNITALVVAANAAKCPDGGTHCQQYGSSAALPASAVKTNTPTLDPYAAQISAMFQTGGAAVPPLGVQTGGVMITAQGSGYTNGTRTFTVVGGTGAPAKFVATVSKGKVTAIASVDDPGAYTVFPTNPVSVTPDTGGGSGATFNLTEGCFSWAGTAIAGRKYCSINLNGAGTTNFPAGSYWIAGGDKNGCVGFCVSSNNATVTSDVAGVTFYLTKGDGSNSLGAGSFATAAITSGTVGLCAPGTNCGTTCTNNAGPASCMLFVQNPAAPTSTSIDTPATTVNSFSGNGTRTLSGLIYLRTQTFSESGNGPILGCVGVIAKYFDIGGTPTFSDGCLPGNGIGGTTTTVTGFSNPYLYQ